MVVVVVTDKMLGTGTSRSTARRKVPQRYDRAPVAGPVEGCARTQDTCLSSGRQRHHSAAAFITTLATPGGLVGRVITVATHYDVVRRPNPAAL